MERNKIESQGRRNFLGRLGAGLLGAVALAAGVAPAAVAGASPTGLPLAFPRWEPVRAPGK